jgi:tetratricopeptide (TPR) repeat protein
MRARYAVLAVSLAIVAGLNSGCRQLEARDNLNKGVTAFKAAQYPAAVDFFKTACERDPDFTTARQYLAMAYYFQFVPGSDAPDNMQFANAALEQFQKVLAKEPNNVLATSSIASLYYNEKKFDEAEEWNKKVIAISPNSKEADSAYYTLGVLAWTKFLTEDRKARLDSGMKPEDPGPIKNAKVREALKEKWMPILDQGIEDEKKALQIDPEYEDAMAYMNLLIRYRGDLLDNTEEYNKAADEANTWMQKSLDTKKMKADRKEAAANGTKTQ